MCRCSAAWYSSYASIIGFPLGLVLYYVLIRIVVLPRNPQQEIESGFDDRFLATSVGKSWVYIGNGERAGSAELGAVDNGSDFIARP